MDKMKILVVGGAGYVGSHTCKALANSGYEPVTFDNMSAGHDWAVQWGPLERGNLLDRDRIIEVVETHQPAAAMHFASLINVGDSVRKPGKYWHNNVMGSINLMEALVSAGVENFVFSSTCAVYAPTDALSLDEELPYGPINAYGKTKRAIEMLIDDFEKAYGIRAAILRYFNASGADADAVIGEAHDPETHLIPLALSAAAGNRGRLKIFGNDYDTPDGTCIRDYIHVSDLAEAHVLSLRHLFDGAPTTAINLGSGKGYSVREVIDCIERILGKNVPADNAPRREGDPARLVANIDRARSVLGWEPRRSNLEKIVSDAWRWHRQHFNYQP
ncbi:MAG: UDP-glucose 4-epimerase GalE [Alphaproteobacteria bacterium]